MYPTYAPYTIPPGTCGTCVDVLAVVIADILGILIWF